MDNYILEVIAFHGTYGSAADLIIDSQSFTKGSLRRDHWLGHGAYFFREDQKQAMIWATYKVKNTPELVAEQATVIQAVIKVSRDEFLNLDSRDDLEKFELFVKQSMEEVKNKYGLRIEEENPHVLRCAFCDQLPESYKVIQMTFSVDSFRFDSNKMLQNMDIRLHGVQVCVRDLSTILGDSLQVVERREVPLTVQHTNRKKGPRQVRM